MIITSQGYKDPAIRSCRIVMMAHRKDTSLGLPTRPRLTLTGSVLVTETKDYINIATFDPSGEQERRFCRLG